MSAPHGAWQPALLVSLKAPVTPNNVHKLTQWHAAEQSTHPNNPFNTTWGAPAGGGPVDYGTPALGVRATARTLLRSSPAYGYGPIVANLRSNGPYHEFVHAVTASRWSEVGYKGTYFTNVSG